MKQINTFLALTALFGWLPPLLTLLVLQYALPGAREWADLTFDVVFVGLYVALLGAGAYLYTRWFS